MYACMYVWVCVFRCIRRLSIKKKKKEKKKSKKTKQKRRNENLNIYKKNDKHVYSKTKKIYIH